MPARLSELPTPSHAFLPRPFPQRRPFPRPARIPGTHPPTPALLICACCVRRLTALDLVAHGGTTLVGTTFTGTFLACATLTGASAHRHLATSSLAPCSSAPRSSALSSLAGTSLVGASLVDASLAGASLAGASLGSQHLYLFWRQTAGARRGTRRLARGCASAREVRERARGCVSAREDARARGEDVAGRGTCSAVWLGPLLRGRS